MLALAMLVTFGSGAAMWGLGIVFQRWTKGHWAWYSLSREECDARNGLLAGAGLPLPDDLDEAFKALELEVRRRDPATCDHPDVESAINHADETIVSVCRSCKRRTVASIPDQQLVDFGALYGVGGISVTSAPGLTTKVSQAAWFIPANGCQHPRSITHFVPERGQFVRECVDCNDRAFISQADLILEHRARVPRGPNEIRGFAQ